jgi:hypothetical protein
MSRNYQVIDADGHVLEPVTLWQDYIDPAYRERAPRVLTDAQGKQRLVIDDRPVGSQAGGIGAFGAIGARDGTVVSDTME